MIFEHIQRPLIQQPTQQNTSEGRFYLTPEGNKYPSVTTVLGHGDNTWLEEWKAKVGPEEAELTSRRAANRGTRIHKLCEDTLNNMPSKPGMFDLEMFSSIKKVFPRINNIRCLELRLYSDILKVAGTVDLIADFDGQPSIIDWKTSLRLKDRNDIPDYFKQCSAYAVAYEERTGVKVPNLVIVMGVDGEKKPLVFIEKTRDWVPFFIEHRKRFKQDRGL